MLNLEVAIANRPDPVPTQIASICPPPAGGNPCVVPPTPVLDAGFPVGSQEMTFKAEIPTATICPKEIRWLVEYKNGVTWTPLHVYTSADSREYEFTENEKLMTRVGLPGLVNGAEHRVSVGYCCGASTNTPSCTCYSDPAYDGTNQDGSPKGFVPSAFRAGVDLPRLASEFQGPTTKYEVEDSFRRSKTRSKRATIGTPPALLGDGLGPDNVWADSNAYSGAGNGSRIADTGNYALIPQSAVVDTPHALANEHQFVELLFGRESGTSANLINVDLHARRFFDGSVLNSYVLKLARNRIGAGDQPDLIFYGTPCPASASCFIEAPGIPSLLELGRFTVPATRPPGMPSTDPNYNCFGIPTLTFGSENKMWVRLRVGDDQTETRAHLYAAIGWDPVNSNSSCGTTDDITKCPRACVFDLQDTTDIGLAMYLHDGAVGFDMRDVNYRLWHIRAASKP